jgi:predicted nucleic-acid-binding Zn-ribbon protein
MWNCPRCREEVDDGFDFCWQCGTSREGVPDPNFQKVEPLDPQPGEYQPLEKPQARGVSPFACPKCQARKVIPDVWVVDRAENGNKQLSVRIDRDPSAWFDTGTEWTELRANVCGQCGYAELYASNPGALWKAYQDRLKRS